MYKNKANDQASLYGLSKRLRQKGADDQDIPRPPNHSLLQTTRPRRWGQAELCCDFAILTGNAVRILNRKERRIFAVAFITTTVSIPRRHGTLHKVRVRPRCRALRPNGASRHRSCKARCPAARVMSLPAGMAGHFRPEEIFRAEHHNRVCLSDYLACAH